MSIREGSGSTGGFSVRDGDSRKTNCGEPATAVYIENATAYPVQIASLVPGTVTWEQDNPRRFQRVTVETTPTPEEHCTIPHNYSCDYRGSQVHYRIATHSLLIYPHQNVAGIRFLNDEGNDCDSMDILALVEVAKPRRELIEQGVFPTVILPIHVEICKRNVGIRIVCEDALPEHMDDEVNHDYLVDMYKAAGVSSNNFIGFSHHYGTCDIDEDSPLERTYRMIYAEAMEPSATAMNMVTAARAHRVTDKICGIEDVSSKVESDMEEAYQVAEALKEGELGTADGYLTAVTTVGHS